MTSPSLQDVRSGKGLRILHVILAMGYGGAERLVRTLAVHGMRNGHQVMVACLDAILAVPEDLQVHGVPLRLVKRRPGVVDPFLCLSLARLVRGQGIDVLHAHDLTSAQQCVLTSLLTGRPVVFTEHSRHYLEERWLRRLEKRLICARVSAVAEVSPLLAQASRERDRVSPGKLRVIENGVDVARFAGADPVRFRASLGLGPQARLIGMVGRLETIKGPQVLLEAFARVARDRPELHLAYVGQGGLAKSLKDRARELGLAERVLLPGSREDIPEVLASIDLVVLPSLSEGLPFALLEAMAAGKPLVASAVGHVPSVLHNGQTGILVPPGDCGSLAAAMALLLEHPQTALNMGALAQAEVERRFAVDAMLGAYEALYRQILSKRRR